MSNLPLTSRSPLPRTGGFTLVEILVAICIIGLLSAFAIQHYSNYKSRTIDTQMRSDLKNAAVAMESYFAEFRSYPNSVAKISALGYQQTEGVSLSITIPTPSSYTLTVSKPNGTQPSFTYDSVSGQIN